MPVENITDLTESDVCSLAICLNCPASTGYHTKSHQVSSRECNYIQFQLQSLFPTRPLRLRISPTWTLGAGPTCSPWTPLRAPTTSAPSTRRGRRASSPACSTRPCTTSTVSQIFYTSHYTTQPSTHNVAHWFQPALTQVTVCIKTHRAGA